MKIHFAKYEPNRAGGGWTFMRNITKAIPQSNYDEADVYFITSPSMVSREDVVKAKEDGKKIILRLDNAVRNSRNRNTGMTRMKDFADWADVVIYQSQWAKEYLIPFTKKDGPVILNGVDLDIYKPSQVFKYDYDSTYLYTRFNRDETKNWEVARYWFSTSAHPSSKLFIVGNFSPELVEGNFDFYNNEDYTFLGVLEEQAMADVYRASKYLIYTYYNDACSNTLIEALVTGCKIAGDTYYRNTGGAKEIREAYRKHGRDYFSIERMAESYLGAIGEI